VLLREDFECRCVYTAKVIPAGLSKRSTNKAAGESKPEAYPLGYVEDFDEPRTTLGAVFTSLLGQSCDVRLRDRSTANPVPADVRLGFFHE
jgi:hypothetical protein